MCVLCTEVWQKAGGLDSDLTLIPGESSCEGVAIPVPWTGLLLSSSVADLTSSLVRLPHRLCSYHSLNVKWWLLPGSVWPLLKEATGRAKLPTPRGSLSLLQMVKVLISKLPSLLSMSIWFPKTLKPLSSFNNSVVLIIGHPLVILKTPWTGHCCRAELIWISHHTSALLVQIS